LLGFLVDANVGVGELVRGDDALRWVAL